MANPVQENIFSQGYFYKPDGARLGPNIIVHKAKLLGQQNYRVSAGYPRQQQNYIEYKGYTSLKGLKGSIQKIQKCQTFIDQVFKEMLRYWFEYDNVSYQKEENGLKMEYSSWKYYQKDNLRWAKKLRVERLENPNQYVQYEFECFEPTKKQQTKPEN